MAKVIFDQRERCGEWAKQKIAHVNSWGEWYQTIGLERDGKLCAVVVFNLYSGADIAMHVASDGSRRWMTRAFLRAVFRYPFIQLGVRRVTGYVPATNRDALDFDLHIGFQPEGRMRQALPDGTDVLILGMLKAECRYL